MDRLKDVVKSSDQYDSCVKSLIEFRFDRLNSTRPLHSTLYLYAYSIRNAFPCKLFRVVLVAVSHATDKTTKSVDDERWLEDDIKFEQYQVCPLDQIEAILLWLHVRYRGQILFCYMYIIKIIKPMWKQYGSREYLHSIDIATIITIQ